MILCDVVRIEIYLGRLLGQLGGQILVIQRKNSIDVVQLSLLMSETYLSWDPDFS